MSNDKRIDCQDHVLGEGMDETTADGVVAEKGGAVGGGGKGIGIVGGRQRDHRGRGNGW